MPDEISQNLIAPVPGAFAFEKFNPKMMTPFFERSVSEETRRSDLYKEFIDAIIEREMLKRQSEFQTVYSVQARRKFAMELAAEMCRRGESRILRTTEIPDDLIVDFVRPGYPKDAVRRDLISACFLERKPPDILFFPHKSHLEFLAAEYILNEMRHNSPQTDSLGFIVTSEIFSFVFEMASDEDWVNVNTHPDSNRKLLLQWLKHIGKSNLPAPDSVEEIWHSELEMLPKKIWEGIIDYYEISRLSRSNETYKMLRRCLTASSIVISVHAFRALSNNNKRPDALEVYEAVGFRRFVDWINLGYIKLEETEAPWFKKEFASYLISLLNLRSHKIR